MADRRSTAHEVWIGEDEHVWLAAGSWRVDVTHLKSQHDCYREAAEVFAHYYDAICDGLEGTDLAYLRARGCLNERYLAARETVRSGGASAPAPLAADREDTM